LLFHFSCALFLFYGVCILKSFRLLSSSHFYLLKLRSLLTDMFLFHYYYYYYYYYYYALQILNLRTLRDRRHQLDAIFVINVLLGSKSCPSTLDIIGLRHPTRNLREFSLLHVSSYYKNCPSGRCVTAANSICNHMDVFSREFVTLSQM
jgi:hypothetical protein